MAAPPRQQANFGWITGNWASALLKAGHIDAARQRQRDSVEAKRLAGLPEVNVLSGELEALRIEILPKPGGSRAAPGGGPPSPG